MKEIKPIETVYHGYRFRSRLEARWAVYFDTDGIEWEYEKEGYDLGAAGLYLPDFWLPRVHMWAEVKPKAFTKREMNKIIKLAKFTGFPVLRLIGIPALRVYYDTTGSDYVVSSTLKWYEKEGRFYFCAGVTGVGDNDENYEFPPQDDLSNHWAFKDIILAVNAAKSARFEFIR